MATFQNNVDTYRVPWTRLTVASASASGDVNGSMQAPFTDVGTTISGVLTVQAAGRTDPGDAAWWVWPAFATDGTRLRGELINPWSAHVREITAPGLSDDVYWALGLINEASPNTGTVDGNFVSFRYTGATRAIGVIRATNGGVGLTNDATPIGTMRRALINAQQGLGAAAFVGAQGWTDAGVESVGDLVNGLTVAGGSFAASDMWWCLAVGRLAATAGTPTVAIEAYVVGYPPVIGGMGITG